MTASTHRGDRSLAAGQRPATPRAGTPGRPPRPRRPRPLIAFGHWWWALPAIIAVTAIHYAATAAGGFFAFTDWSGIGSFEFIGWDNFTRILADPVQLGALRNTLLIAFGSVVLTNVIGLGLALALNRGLKTRYVLRVLLFMPVVLSPLAVSYIWKFIFEYNGPLNQFLGALGLTSLQKAWLADPTWSIWVILVVVVWQNTGIAMVIYLANLASVDPGIEEAAALDGAGVMQRFRHITLPSIRPAIAISTTLGLINGFRVFDQIMALTGGGPAGATETLATEVYKETFSLGNFGYGAALALMLTVIILVFAIVQQRVTRDRSKEGQ
ncbi:raffinose/stachyose/melibiose transport system permease protein [Thermocatellispora tengchongensis]|uniref:Raffinose/stachyose/melibiose transport system permease protein n=1 Tax=Thermocatellispora tengchongensis TaxID=1073253 RepID=A0A840PN56_9ACTN|nr:sugar ABC transporter permease [Thermocatellispora tengchongensis]MBB5138477.1 raffinose/stachyose/melibiose transport system permease protein [Thermocatellispora tengchongensis]